MNRFILTINCLLFSYVVSAQVFEVGVINANGTDVKLSPKGNLILTDSTFTTMIMGTSEVKKVVQKSEAVTYITDGVSVDKITITPMTNRLKGFAYDHTVLLNLDVRFGGQQIIFFCRKTEQAF